jgi:hypothetical protein
MTVTESHDYRLSKRSLKDIINTRSHNYRKIQRMLHVLTVNRENEKYIYPTILRRFIPGYVVIELQS